MLCTACMPFMRPASRRIRLLITDESESLCCLA
jgi:hypothetical protein